MTTWIKGTCKLVYSPARPGLKKKRAANDFIIVAEMPGDIAKYYSYWIKKKLYLNLQLPAWRPHITVLDGRKPVDDSKLHLWEKHAGKTVDFEYSIDVEQHWKFWVLPVRSEKLTEIRTELGFAPNAHNFHLTIGRMG